MPATSSGGCTHISTSGNTQSGTGRSEDAAKESQHEDTGHTGLSDPLLPCELEKNSLLGYGGTEAKEEEQALTYHVGDLPAV
jgi:hypothetical protein